MTPPTISQVHRGLALLTNVPENRYFRRMDDAARYDRHLKHHPFGCDMPTAQPGYPPPTCHFVGASATDMSIESFLVHLTFWLRETTDGMLIRLRVLSVDMPDTACTEDIFYEVWLRNGTVLISGDSNREGGAGTAANERYEAVFAALAKLYDCEIERIGIPRGQSPSYRALHNGLE